MDYKLIKSIIKHKNNLNKVGIIDFCDKDSLFGEVHLTEKCFKSIIEEGDIPEIHSQYCNAYDVLKLEKHGIKFFTLVDKEKGE